MITHSTIPSGIRPADSGTYAWCDYFSPSYALARLEAVVCACGVGPYFLINNPQSIANNADVGLRTPSTYLSHPSGTLPPRAEASSAPVYRILNRHVLWRRPSVGLPPRKCLNYSPNMLIGRRCYGYEH